MFCWVKFLIITLLSLSSLHSVEKVVSKTGYYTLDWSKQSAAGTFRLFERRGNEPAPGRLVYQGDNKKLFQSGRQNGDFYYTLKNKESETLLKQWHVNVKHHTLELALALLLAGAVVFVLTAVSLHILYRRSERSLL